MVSIRARLGGLTPKIRGYPYIVTEIKNTMSGTGKRREPFRTQYRYVTCVNSDRRSIEIETDTNIGSRRYIPILRGLVHPYISYGNKG